MANRAQPPHVSHDTHSFYSFLSMYVPRLPFVLDAHVCIRVLPRASTIQRAA